MTRASRVIRPATSATAPSRSCDGVDLDVPSRLAHRDPRPVGQRQDDAAARARRVRASRHAERSRSASARRRRRRTARARPSAAAIGYVPQEGSLFPHLTVAGERRASGCPRGSAAARVDELLEMVGLADLGAPLPAPALRRPAAAGRARSRAGRRARAWCCSTSRSPRSTRTCARASARDVRADPARGRRDGAARHPRPGRWGLSWLVPL